MDFKNHYISIKPGYWKCFVQFVKTELVDIANGKLLAKLKLLFISRFALISANHLKKFFMNEVFSSFIDFKNILYYCVSYSRNGNVSKKDIDSLRLERYFERKAKAHYLWVYEHKRNMSAPDDLEIVDDIINERNAYFQNDNTTDIETFTEPSEISEQSGSDDDFDPLSDPNCFQPSTSTAEVNYESVPFISENTTVRRNRDPSYHGQFNFGSARLTNSQMINLQVEHGLTQQENAINQNNVDSLRNLRRLGENLDDDDFI